MIIRTRTPQETMDLGKKLAGKLVPDSVIALNGTLGAGKTVFTKGIALGLGISETIKSPTFTIICQYEGRLPLYHMDAYRIFGDEEFEMTGGKELLTGGGVSVIEWSENIADSMPENIIEVNIRVISPEEREIEIKGIEP